jgi:hypothetical protein
MASPTPPLQAANEVRYAIARRKPALRALVREVAGERVQVRAFADYRGALVVTRRGLFVVEVADGAEGLDDASAAWFYELDKAANASLRMVLVRNRAGLERLAEAVREAAKPRALVTKPEGRRRPRA